MNNILPNETVSYIKSFLFPFSVIYFELDENIKRLVTLYLHCRYENVDISFHVFERLRDENCYFCKKEEKIHVFVKPCVSLNSFCPQLLYFFLLYYFEIRNNKLECKRKIVNLVRNYRRDSIKNLFYCQTIEMSTLNYLKKKALHFDNIILFHYVLIN